MHIYAVHSVYAAASGGIKENCREFMCVRCKRETPNGGRRKKKKQCGKLKDIYVIWFSI